MTSQQKRGLLAGGGILVALVGLWVFWGSTQGQSEQQQEVLSELTTVVEEAEADTATSTTAEPATDESTTAPETTAAETTAAETTSSTETTTAPDPATSTSDASDTDITAPETTAAETTAGETTPTEPTTTTEATTTETTTTETTTTEAPATDGPSVATFEIVETIPHDTGAFTQGLEISNGRLFESTGLVGRSSIRELDLDTGEVLRNTAVPDVFGEGLTIVGDTAIQITWQDEVAFRYDLDTFDIIQTYEYDGEGWGLCLADQGSGNLVMSDGSSELSFRNPDTFEIVGSIDVRLDGAPIENLNELECIGDTVWANIWLSGLIVEIDPSTGEILTVLDADSLRPESTAGDSGAVWNGLAYDPTDGTLLVTGKLWPTIFRLEISTN